MSEAISPRKSFLTRHSDPHGPSCKEEDRRNLRAAFLLTNRGSVLSPDSEETQSTSGSPRPCRAITYKNVGFAQNGCISSNLSPFVSFASGKVATKKRKEPGQSAPRLLRSLSRDGFRSAAVFSGRSLRRWRPLSRCAWVPGSRPHPRLSPQGLHPRSGRGSCSRPCLPASSCSFGTNHASAL